MELEASLSWLALTMTPGIAARLSARLLREFGSAEGVFRASLARLEACNLTAPVAHAIFNKQTFWRAEKEVDAKRRIGCKVVNWSEPEYPQNLLQIYDPPVMLYVRGDASILNSPALGMVGTRWPTIYDAQMAERISRDLASRGLTIVSERARDWRAGHRHRRVLSERKQEIVREGAGARCDHQSVPNRMASGAGKFSGAQPHHRRDGDWCGDCGG